MMTTNRDCFETKGIKGAGATARYLAWRGIGVFPCDRKSKRPLVATGFKAATTDPDRVREWWAACPSALIGVPTGTKFTVVDVDLQHEAAQGGSRRTNTGFRSRGRTPPGRVASTSSSRLMTR